MKTILLFLCIFLVAGANSSRVSVNEREFHGDVLINDGDGVKFKTFVDKYGQTHITADVDREFLALEIAKIQKQDPAVSSLIQKAGNEDGRPKPVPLSIVDMSYECWVYKSNEGHVKGTRVLQYEGSAFVSEEHGSGDAKYTMQIEVPRITSTCVEE
jgi:hypothetical protein